MRNVVLNHISSTGYCNPLEQTNPMLDSTTMLDNGNFGFCTGFSRVFHHCFLVTSGATISTPAISTPAFLILLRFPLPRFQSPRLSSVTFVHPTQAIEIFGNVLRHLVTWPSVTFG